MLRMCFRNNLLIYLHIQGNIRQQETKGNQLSVQEDINNLLKTAESTSCEAARSEAFRV